MLFMKVRLSPHGIDYEKSPIIQYRTQKLTSKSIDSKAFPFSDFSKR